MIRRSLARCALATSRVFLPAGRTAGAGILGVFVTPALACWIVFGGTACAPDTSGAAAPDAARGAAEASTREAARPVTDGAPSRGEGHDGGDSRPEGVSRPPSGGADGVRGDAALRRRDAAPKGTLAGKRIGAPLPTIRGAGDPCVTSVDCDDNDVCNGSEACVDDVCVAGTPLTVDDANPCTEDTCDPVDGVDHAPEDVDFPCSDGNVCNGAETCDGAGTCDAGTPLVVDDGNSCTTDACDPGTGVSHVPVTNGTPCTGSNLCYGPRFCSAGSCATGTPITGYDGDPCTQDLCDPLTGIVTNPAIPEGGSCSDGNPCNGAETCTSAGACVTGTPPTVDDGNPCTTDACGPGGVTHTLRPEGSSCEDSDECNGHETCSAAGVCQPGTPLDVDDGDPCTVDSCSIAGFAHDPVDVDDADPCTDDVCLPSGAIVHGPVLSPTCCAMGAPSTTTTLPGGSGAFLTACGHPLQAGFTVGVFDDVERAGLAHGTVLTREGVPLPGATIRVLGRPELGETKSRADGRWDMRVLGGGRLVFSIVGPGSGAARYLGSQRAADVPRAGDVNVGEVRLVAVDPVVTEVTLDGTSTDWQIATSSVVSDANGARATTLFLPPGLTASRKRGGVTTPLTVGHLRATEYTVGPNGPAAMPADLPPSTGYTFAVELSLDEALEDMDEVVFTAGRAVGYVESFLATPVGATVPVGTYRRNLGAWTAEPNGRVVKILGVTGGMADLDVDAVVGVDSGAALIALGITDGEREALAAQYAIGTTLWRFSLDHFTPADLNWAYECDTTPASQCVSNPPPPTPPPREPPPRDPCLTPGSIIGCEGQTLAEEIPLAGTGLTLRYSSDRAKDPFTSNKLRVRVVDGSVPGGTRTVKVRYEVAGRLIERAFTPGAAPATDEWEWDGLDSFGQPVTGLVWATASVSHAYGLTRVLVPGAAGGFAFGVPAGGSLSADANDFATFERTASRRVPLSFDPFPHAQTALGIGWDVTQHNVHQGATGQLWYGDGRRVSDAVVSSGTRLVMGTGSRTAAGSTNVDARSSTLVPTSVAVAADGSVLIGDTTHGPGAGSPTRIVRVDRAGIVRQVVGGGTTSGAGPMPVASYRFSADVRALTTGPDGSIYFADVVPAAGWGVFRLDPLGVVRMVACGGAGTPHVFNDGDAAYGAKCGTIFGIRVGPDGALFLATYMSGPSSGSGAILRVGAEGKIFRVAGGGTTNLTSPGSTATVHPNEGGAPRSLRFNDANDLEVLNDGSVVFPSNGYLWSIDRNGVLHHLAGWNVSPLPPAPYGSSSNVKRMPNLHDVRGIAKDRDGGLYVTDYSGVRVLYLPGDGTSRLVAGQSAVNALGSTPSENLDPQARDQARFGRVSRVAVRDDGTVYVVDDSYYRVRAISPAVQGVSNGEIAIDDGQSGLRGIYSGDGRHLRTVDPRVLLASSVASACVGRSALAAGTPTRVAELCYDAQGVLSGVGDSQGRLTTFGRTTPGHVTITSPDGQVTELVTDVDGQLVSLQDAAGSTATFGYGARGLLSSYSDLAGRTHSFGFDADGRLLQDRDAKTASGSAFKTLARTDLADGHRVDVTDAIGRVTAYEMRVAIENGLRIEKGKVTRPDGAISQRTSSENGNRTVTAADGTITSTEATADPRWGSVAAYASKSVVTVPGRSPVTTTTTVTAPHSATNMDDWTTETTSRTRNGKTWTDVWNKTTRSRTITSPVGRVTTQVVDDRGRVTNEAISGLEPATLTYDASTGRLTSSARGLRTQARTYGTDGYLASLTDGLSQVTTFQNDALGRVTLETRPDLEETAFAYDGTSLMTQLTPPGAAPHGMAYDTVGLLDTYTPPTLPLVPTVTTAYAYDKARRRTSITLPDGRIINYLYDTAGRLEKTVLPGTEGDIVRTYATSPVTGHIASVAGPDAIAFATARAGSLPTSVTWSSAVSGVVSWSYDAELRVATEVAAGVSVAMTYDNDDLVTAAGPVSLTRPAAPTAPIVTGVTVGSVTETIGYDQIEGGTTRKYGEPTQHTVNYGGTTLYDLALVRDPLGRIIQRTELVNGTSRVYEYGYDLAGRLSTVSLGGTVINTYTYDANGNRLTEDGTTVVGVYDAQDRIVSYDATTFVHDANGNRTSETTGGVTKSYVHDAQGTLREATAGATSVKYVVDGSARRVKRTVGGSTVTHQWLYRDDLQIAAELDGAGALRWRFVYASGKHVPDAAIDGSGVVYRIVTDQVGSLRLVVRASDGVVVQRMRHDAWGRIEDDYLLSGAHRVPFGFAGGLHDRETGLVHFGAREYDPAVGRWTTKDPIRWEGGTTGLYEYVGTRPLDRVDPRGTFNPFLGTDPEEVCAALEGLGLACPFGPPSAPDGDIGLSACEGGADEPTADESCVAKENLGETARSFAGRCSKGSIKEQFPDELWGETLGYIQKCKTKPCKKAWKLLNDNRFKK